MKMRPLGPSGLEIAPLVFGGNVFGWTLDEKASFDVLDAFVDHGFNAIDTADVYSNFIPGNVGGESETIIGNWLRARPGMRDKVLIMTKVGLDMGGPDKKGLSERWIMEGVDNSLSRLGVERIDLYFSHAFDPDTPQEETLGAYDKLLKAGKIRSIGASNFTAEQLKEARDIASRNGIAGYQVVQPEHNLYDRATFEGPLRDFCTAEGLGVVTFFSLASGFLSGKYRTKADAENRARSGFVGKYFDAKGERILAALDKVSGRHGARPAEVALAWLMASPGVTAPIASATSVEQVNSFANAASLVLSVEDVAELDRAGA